MSEPLKAASKTDELRAKFEEWYPDFIGDVQPFDCYVQGHASRDAEVEALRKDAERYRAIRLAAICENDSFIERMILGVPAKDCTESQFDEAIDAAMKEEIKK